MPILKADSSTDIIVCLFTLQRLSENTCHVNPVVRAIMHKFMQSSISTQNELSANDPATTKAYAYIYDSSHDAIKTLRVEPER